MFRKPPHFQGVCVYNIVIMSVYVCMEVYLCNYHTRLCSENLHIYGQMPVARPADVHRAKAEADPAWRPRAKDDVRKGHRLGDLEHLLWA